MATGKENSSREQKAADGQQAQFDALFRLPPPEFVAARNALAATLKKGGHEREASRVKALPKPSISAWTINQLYWRHRDAFDALLEAGERFRQGQASRLQGHGPDIRALLNQWRESLAGMSRLAVQILQQSSGSAPANVMRRVTASLEAISAYGRAPGAPPAGRLVEDVEPPGFESLAALVPQVGETHKGNAPSRLLSFQKQPPGAAPAKGPTRRSPRDDKQLQARLVAARAARQKAAQALTQAKAGAAQAQAALKRAATRARQAEQAMVAAEERLQRLASAAHEARQQARRAAVEAESAAQAVEDAGQALEQAARGERDAERAANKGKR